MTDHDLFTLASVIAHQSVMVWMLAGFALTAVKALGRTPPVGSERFSTSYARSTCQP